MSIDFNILNEESLENIRNIAKESGYSALFDLKSLVLEHDLRLVASPYDFDSKVELLIPESNSWDKNYDRENAIRIFNALPNFLRLRLIRVWDNARTVPIIRAIASVANPIPIGARSIDTCVMILSSAAVSLGISLSRLSSRSVHRGPPTIGLSSNVLRRNTKLDANSARLYAIRTRIP